MLQRKESIKFPSYTERLNDANDLFEAGRWCDEEGDPTASTRNYAQALTIYNDIYNSPAGLALSGNPKFHIDFAQLYHSFAYHVDSEPMYGQAMFHYGTAAELLEEARDYESAAYTRQMQADLLKLQGDYEQAGLYEKMSEKFNQDTAEFPATTEEQLQAYDQATDKPRSPRKLVGGIVSKLVSIIPSSKS
jgi:tetratricopeptide (TPR) repeat protein